MSSDRAGFLYPLMKFFMRKGFREPARVMLSFTLGIALIVSLVAVVTVVPTIGNASPTGQSASLSQCTNGPVGPPLLAQPCVGSNTAAVTTSITGDPAGTGSFKNWVNGNSNGSKSHWR